MVVVCFVRSPRFDLCVLIVILAVVFTAQDLSGADLRFLVCQRCHTTYLFSRYLRGKSVLALPMEEVQALGRSLVSTILDFYLCRPGAFHERWGLRSPEI